MDKKIIKDILENEYSISLLFSKTISKNGYIRFYDERIKDMYDHNFTDLSKCFSEEIFNELLEYKKEFKERHINITTFEKIDHPLLNDFDKECLLTMGATKLNVKPLKIKNITFKNLKENKNIANDILLLETKYYGEEYGIDFTARKLYRYFSKIQEDNGLNYFVCYFNNNVVAYCYTYFDKNVVALDGLLVDEKFRHLNIASNLILYVKNYYNCPIYLHADLDESAKDLYLKIGFESLYKKYSYLKVDKNK